MFQTFNACWNLTSVKNGAPVTQRFSADSLAPLAGAQRTEIFYGFRYDFLK